MDWDPLQAGCLEWRSSQAHATQNFAKSTEVAKWSFLQAEAEPTAADVFNEAPLRNAGVGSFFRAQVVARQNLHEEYKPTGTENLK